MPGVKFNHQANRRVILQLRGMQKRTQDLTTVWPSVGAYLSREIRRQFSTRGKHFNAAWKPLALSTRLQKRNAGFPRSPLVRTGALRRSFVGRPMDIEIYEKQSATFGSSLDTANWQQRGTRRNGKRHIPPRVILKSTPEQAQEVKRIITKRIMGRKREPE